MATPRRQLATALNGFLKSGGAATSNGATESFRRRNMDDHVCPKYSASAFPAPSRPLPSSLIPTEKWETEK